MIGFVIFWLWLRRQPVGTRSILVGAHQFVLHPVFVALAWRKLMGGWPIAIPVWFAFVVHDWGYWGLHDMDGDEGKRHPIGGAAMMHAWFDSVFEEKWWKFTAGHSRYFAELQHIPTSDLMRVDKYATAIVPLPLYLACVLASGECWEYVQYHHDYHGKPTTDNRWRDLWFWVNDLRADWRKNFGPR